MKGKERGVLNKNDKDQKRGEVGVGKVLYKWVNVLAIHPVSTLVEGAIVGTIVSKQEP